MGKKKKQQAAAARRQREYGRVQERVDRPYLRAPQFRIAVSSEEYGTFIDRATFAKRLVDNLSTQGHEVLGIEVTPIVGTFIAMRFGAVPTVAWMREMGEAGVELHVAHWAEGGPHTIVRLPVRMYEDGIWVATDGSMLGAEPLEEEPSELIGWHKARGRRFR